MWQVIRALVDEGATLLLTTQYLEEADELATSIAVVDRGKIIARGTSDELKRQVGGERIEVVVRREAAIPQVTQMMAALDSRAGQVAVDQHTRRLTMATNGGADFLLALVRQLGDEHIEIDDVGLHRPTLDDVFLTLTGHSAEEEAAAAQNGKQA
jgi:ABC-2 type transport system ATP-binding protein